MRTFYLSLFLLVLLLQPVFSQASVNEEESKISFVFVDDDVDGTISGFQFNGVIDLEDISRMALNGSVEMETLDTDNWLRDRHLRSRKYFNNREYPNLEFKSSNVSKQGDLYIVEGTLTIKGIVKSVSWSFKRQTDALIGTTTIYTSDFDINIHKERERTQVDITINLALK